MRGWPRASSAWPSSGCTWSWLWHGALPQGDGRPANTCWVVLSDITEQKRTESGLWLDAEKYRALVESMDTAIAVIDSDARVLCLNDAGAAQFAGAPEKLVGKSLFELLPAEMAERNMGAVREAIVEDKGIISELREKVARTKTKND